METIAADTNVVVRFLTRDEQEQFRKALDMFTQETVYIPNTVWLESEWVLRHAYQFTPSQVSMAFRALLGLPQVRVNDAPQLLLAVEWHALGLDFADALHLALSQEMKRFATFDKAFARKASGLGACDVIDLAVS